MNSAIGGAADTAVGLLELSGGALATSGDTHHDVLKDGVRYGHVLDPRTGWPVADAPRSVTVHAQTCTGDGLLAKLAILRGSGAEGFLKTEEVKVACMVHPVVGRREGRKSPSVCN